MSHRTTSQYRATKKEFYGKEVAQYFDLEDTDLDPYIVYRTPAEKTNKEDEAEDATTANGYIRWDALCHLFNSHVIPKNPKDNVPSFVVTCVQVINEDLPINSDVRSGKHVSPLLMAKVDNPLANVIAAGENQILDSSLDPTICLLPRQFRKSLNNVRSKQLQRMFAAHGIVPAVGDQTMVDDLEKMCNYDLSEHEKNYYIGHILLNVQRLQQMYQSMKKDEDGVEKEDFFFLDFVKNIWKSVNDACGGNHDFKITTDFERPNIVRVVDMRYQENINLKDEDIIELNIQSNTSIVRDFAYNTSIPSSLSSTIAIAAQAPDNVDSLQAASFGAFHKNISNRFARFIAPKEGTKPTEEEINLLSDSFDSEMMTYVTGLKDLASHIDSILGGNFLVVADGGDAIRSEEIGKYKGLLNAIKRSSQKLIKMYPDNQGDNYKGEYIKNAVQSPTSAIIPLKFNATLDGISGVVIGNVFKLPNSRLPRGYKNANIAFVVMGEDQKITSGQDWTTKITGQMIILPKKGKGTTGGGWEGFDYNQFDESADTTNLYVSEQPGDVEISNEQKNTDINLNAVREGDAIYLKMGKDDTHVRSSSDIDHESEADWDDNVIGLFRRGNKGLYLGTIEDITNNPIYVMIRDKDGTDQYYKANSDGTPNKNKPVDPENIPNSSWPWYKINFGKEAISKFKVGWINDEDGDRDKDGADEFDAAIWTQNKQGWMRMDVLFSETTALAYKEKVSLQEELTRLEIYKLGNDDGDWSFYPRRQAAKYSAKESVKMDRERWEGYFKFFITDVFREDSNSWKDLQEYFDMKKDTKDVEYDFDLFKKHKRLRAEYNGDDMNVGINRRIAYLNELRDLED